MRRFLERADMTLDQKLNCRPPSSSCCWRWRTISSRSQFAGTKMPSARWPAPWPTPTPGTEPATRRACSAALVPLLDEPARRMSPNRSELMTADA